MPSGVIKALGGAVELRLKGYQVLPPSLHPSGLPYEWITSPLDESGGVRSPKTLTTEEFKRLLGLLGIATYSEKQREEPQQARRGGTGNGDKWRRLSQQAKDRLAELLRPLYVPGHRQTLWLYLAGALAKQSIDPRDCTEVLLRLYYETGDSDGLKVRGAAVVYSYAKMGHQEAKNLITETLGVAPYGPESLGAQKVKGLRGIKEVATAVFGGGCATSDDKCLMETKARASELVDEIRRHASASRRKDPPLPVDYDFSQLPDWVRQLEIKMRRLCLEHNVLYGFCSKEIRALKSEKSQYILFILATRVRMCEGRGEERTCRIATSKVTKLVLLPRFMGRVFDPYYNEYRYVAVKDGKLVAVVPADKFDEFIELVRQSPPCFIIKTKKCSMRLRPLYPP